MSHVREEEDVSRFTAYFLCLVFIVVKDLPVECTSLRFAVNFWPTFQLINKIESSIGFISQETAMDRSTVLDCYLFRKPWHEVTHEFMVMFPRNHHDHH